MATVLNQLRFHAPLSRADLAKRTGLNRSTISSIVAALLQDGLVHETELQTDKIGRPGRSVELNPGGGCAIGVEIGVDFIAVILTNFVADILWRQRVSMHDTEQTAFLRRAEELVEQALHEARARGLRVFGIGLGVPGLVDGRKGELQFAPNLKWHNVAFRTLWTARFDVPVFVENEANAAALGEHYFGVARNVDTFIYLSAGMGLGGGIVIGGKLFRGAGGYAGEIGHITFDPQGERCACGKYGCWETLVSPRAIVSRFKQQLEAGVERTTRGQVYPDGDTIGFAEVVGAATSGDAAATTVMHEVGHILGIGIANLINIFNPQLIILGGALTLPYDLLLPVVAETVRRHSLDLLQANVAIVPSTHGADDCVLGTVALVLDDILRDPA